MTATTVEKSYRPGLRFWSPYLSYQVICRPYTRQLTMTGEFLSETRELLAEFGVHRGEYSYQSPDGFTESAADITGHYFDLDAQAQEKGWTEDEKEIVARIMLREVQKAPYALKLVEQEAPVAVAAPWPTYDDTHHNQIPTLAAQLGLVREALAYELENKHRASVIDKLNEINAAAPAASEGDGSDELIAA